MIILADLTKKLEQLEKLKKQIEEQKTKTQTSLGKQLIESLDFDYEELNKEKVKELVKDLSLLYNEKYKVQENESNFENANN